MGEGGESVSPVMEEKALTSDLGGFSLMGELAGGEAVRRSSCSVQLPPVWPVGVEGGPVCTLGLRLRWTPLCIIYSELAVMSSMRGE